MPNIHVLLLIQSVKDTFHHQTYLAACPKRTTAYILYHILPPARHLDSLRERGHPFSLPDFSTSIHKMSFVVRTLYNLI